MAAQKLETLGLAYFRGASRPTTIEFDPSKKITMIFGENGSGKSSIVDAFSFLCDSDFGSLNDRSGVDKKFVTSTTGKPDQLRVTLDTSNGRWVARLSTSKIQVSPSSGLPSLRVLRRSTILRLVDAPPAKRYDALQEYIAVPGITKAEESLRSAANDAERNLREFISAATRASETLESTWRNEGCPKPDAYTWATQEVQQDTQRLEADVAAANTLLTLIAEAKSRYTSQVATDNDLNKAEGILATAITDLQQAEAVSSGATANLVALLQQAKAYVDKNKSISSCPVCVQPIEANNLLNDLSQRLSVMAQLQIAVTKVTAANKNSESCKTLADAALQAWLLAAEQLRAALTSSTLECVAAVLSKADLQLAVGEDSADERRRVFSTLITVTNQLETPLQQLRDTAQKTLARKAAIAAQVRAITASTQQRDREGKLVERLRAILEVVERLRKQFITGVLNEISNDVSALYAFLHPDEPLGGVQLKLAAGRIGSLELFSQFYDQKSITPQSLYSESHLDTLGLCVFIALAKKYRTENTLIVLDDVLTSVDADHLNRFIELLHEESKHFAHIIITTHYRPWRDRYRNHRAPTNELHFVELRGWSLLNGIRQQTGLSAIAELKAELNSTQFDRQSVASKAGVLLESLLDFLALQFGCRLPRKHEAAYTLRELSDCFKKELLAQLKAEREVSQPDGSGSIVTTTVTVALGPIIDGIKALAIIRNEVGGHYNVNGAGVTDKEVETFGNLALQLGESLICPVGGDLPSKKDSNVCWRSRKGNLRLFPLTHP